jgi:hypothetical protein
MPLVNAAKNLMLDALAGINPSISAAFASLHSGDPGPTGANEVAGGAPAYARKSITWNAAAAGSLDNNANPVFDVPAGTTVRWLGLWSAVTAGTFLGYMPLGGGSQKPFGVDDIGTEVLDAPAHGFTNDQQVVVWAAGGTLPGGLAEGTVFFVIGATTDSLQLSTTLGGSAVNITAIGTGTLQRIIPEVYGGQGTYTVADADLALLYGMATESDVQLATEGSGPKVRTLLVRTLVDNVPTDVEMQVVAIADEQGRPLDERLVVDAVNALTEAVYEIRDLLKLALEDL